VYIHVSSKIKPSRMCEEKIICMNQNLKGVTIFTLQSRPSSNLDSVVDITLVYKATTQAPNPDSDNVFLK
jgi:hypothetical protein